MTEKNYNILPVKKGKTKYYKKIPYIKWRDLKKQKGFKIVGSTILKKNNTGFMSSF